MTGDGEVKIWESLEVETSEHNVDKILLFPHLRSKDNRRLKVHAREKGGPGNAVL